MTEEKPTTQEPWVEKFRPHTIDDIVQQEEVVETLKATINGADLPHLIFYGPPGTGKTSTAGALCRTIFKPSEMKRRVMELNASDERGIDTIRKKVKQFASLSVPAGGVPYKIIILDEADSMTIDAQNALRRIIETYSSVTRFIIICNYISKIADPILSRCARFRFRSLTKESIISRLQFIAQNENITISDDDAFEALVDISGGDLRKAITYLQSASICGIVTSKILREVAGRPAFEDVLAYFETCSEGGSWNDISGATEDIVFAGYDVTQILEMLSKICVNAQNIPEHLKADLILKIAEADGRITASRADPLIQFSSVGTAIWNAAHSN